MRMTVEKLLGRLDGVKKTGPNRWIAKTPTRDERTASLGIRELDDGRILLHDFGGDDTESILSAIGLTFSDLFPEKLPHHSKRERRPFPATDILRLISFEALVVMIVAEDMGKGEMLSSHNRQRVATAAIRIRDALAAGGIG